MARSLFPLLLSATVLLGGCMTPLPPVSATRFHRIDQSIALAAGSYGFRATQNASLSDRPDPSYAAAVSRQLDLLGYRSVMTAAAGAGSAGQPTGGASEPDYIIDMAVVRSERESVARSPVSVGVGGSTGSYGSGLGVGLGVNLNSLFGGGDGSVITTRLMVRLTRRGEGEALWEGRAESLVRAGSPAAQPGLAADKLATALFQGFPGNSGETISVP